MAKYCFENELYPYINLSLASAYEACLQDGKFEPGPSPYPRDVMCKQAEPGLPRYGQVPKEGELRQRRVEKGRYELNVS